MLPSIAYTRVETAPCESADAKMKTTGGREPQSQVLQHGPRRATALLAPNLFNLKDGDFLLSFKGSDGD